MQGIIMHSSTVIGTVALGLLWHLAQHPAHYLAVPNTIR